MSDLPEKLGNPSANPEPFEPPQILTTEMRREVLGKLAEFELCLTELPDRKAAFVLAYLANPTDAAAAVKRAGYADTQPSRKGTALLNEAPIAHCIALGANLREDRTRVTSDRTLQELAIIAFSDISNYTVDWETGNLKLHEGVPEYATRAVASVEHIVTTRGSGEDATTTHRTKIRLWSKTDALRMLALYQKLLLGNTAVVVDQSTTINDNRGQTHNYQHNEWSWGDRTIKF
jgi:phage terminase small subunit